MHFRPFPCHLYFYSIKSESDNINWDISQLSTHNTTNRTLIIFYYIIYMIITITSTARQLLYLHEYKMTSLTSSIFRKIHIQNVLNFVHDYKNTPIFLMTNKEKILILYSGKYGTSITELIYSIFWREVPTKVQSCSYITNYSF
jgi:hypothetical protein